jgi:hypothetical protein
MSQMACRDDHAEARWHGLPARALLLLVLVGSLLLASALMPSAAVATSLKANSLKRCTDDKDKAKRLDLKVKGEKTFGYFALPDRKPRGLVVFAHGHHHSAILWRDNLKEAAQRNGIVAVAMNYRHLETNLDKNSPDYGRSTGFRFIEGAEDSIAAARYMIRHCERLTKRPVVAYGVSGGIPSSGFTVSSRAKRPGGKRPLFDYWFDIEGLADVAGGYLLTREFGIPVFREIEEAFGGTYEERTELYERYSIVNRAPEIKASGVKGVVLVHATDDATVPYFQSQEMYERLREVGVPSHFFTVNPSGAPVQHGTEIDRSHPVINTSFERLAALFNDGIRPRCFEEFAVDGASGAITPDPASAAC